MKKSKGFTLVELLGVIVILGIIMLIAIPRITGLSEKQKKRTYVSDASRMIAVAKKIYGSDTTINTPTNNTCVLLKLEDLGLKDLMTGPEGGEYDENYSYVTINYSGGTYSYGIQLLETYKSSGGNTYRGVKYTTHLSMNDVIRAGNNKEAYVATNSYSSNVP